MIRWGFCGLVVLVSSIAVAQTADVIREITGSETPIKLRLNPLGGMPVAARKEPPKTLPLPLNDIPDTRHVRPIIISDPPKLDRHGDPLPIGAVARFGTVHLRHGAEVKGIAFSHDGKHLYTLSASEATVKVWDPITGKEVSRIKTAGQFFGVTKDGSVVVIHKSHVRVCLPDTHTIRDLPEKTLPKDAIPTALAVDPDGRSVAIATDNKVLQIDLQTGKTLRELKLPSVVLNNNRLRLRRQLIIDDSNLSLTPYKLMFSPDGHWLVGSGNSTGVWLWNLHTGKRVRTYRTELANPVYAFSPDVTKIAVVGDRLRLYSLDTDEEVEGFSGPENTPLSALRFSSDGQILFTVQTNGKISLYDALTGKEKQTYDPPDMGFHPPFEIAPDGTTIAAVDQTGGLYLWNAKTRKEVGPPRLPPLVTPAISADGKSISILDQTNRIRTFDLKTGEPGKTVEIKIAFRCSLTAWDPVHHRVAITDYNENPAMLRIIDVDSQKQLSDHEVSRRTYSRVAFASANRDRLVLFPQDDAISVMNPNTGKTVQIFDVGDTADHIGISARGGRFITDDSVGCISPDGRLVAVASYSLTLLEVATGRKRLTLETIRRPLLMNFSADSRFLAVWDVTGFLSVVDVRTGSIIRRYQQTTGNEMLSSLALSHDGKRLAAGSPTGRVTIWDVASGTTLAPFTGHDSEVTGLAFTPNATQLISTSQDGTALLWNVPSNPLPVSSIEILSMDFDEAFRLLGSSNPAEAQQGLEFLYRHPDETVKQMSQRIPTPPATANVKLAAFIADLANDDYSTREAAMKSLETIGGEAKPFLQEVSQKSTNAEARKRAAELLARIDILTTRPDDLRILRVVELMENIRTPQARTQLEKWAAGVTGHRLTTEASAAIARWKTTEGK